MPARRRSDLALVAGLLVAAVVAAAVVAARGSASKRVATPAARPISWQGLVGGGRPDVALGQRVIVVLRAPSLADRVREAGGRATDAQERRWSADALAAQQRLLLRLATKGVFIRPTYRYTRVVDGFAAVLDQSTILLLERTRAVAGVYRVRAAFPALASAVPLRTVVRSAALGWNGTPLLGLEGRGVLVALLDTGVDPETPFLHGHVLPGLDVAGGGIDARPQSAPGQGREEHGTEMAGIVVGVGRDGLSGIAPEATVLPIRVGGWQRDAPGRWSIHARSDEILAGLERAVDPDGNGDAHDAARIALVPLAEPFAGFEDDPLSRAAAGAAELNTLVVVPAGNDGPTAPGFGSLSGPGGAPAALTVAAADLRPLALVARLAVRRGLHVLLDRDVPVLGATAPRSASFLLVAPRLARGRPQLVDARGESVVAGRAAILPAGPAPTAAAAAAADAGAGLVLLAGDALPGGGLGLASPVGVPVLGVPESLFDAAARSGRTALQVSVGAARPAANEQASSIAPFSAYGLAYGGHPKPEVAGPGVGIVTAAPGAASGGSSRFVTVNGSSAAAAAVAAEAALVVEARPDLDARALESALVGSARPLAGAPAAAQGNGVVDLAAAATAEVVAEPPTLSFGRAAGRGWSAERTLLLRNVSTRPLRIDLAAVPARVRSGVAIGLDPGRVVLAPGASAPVRVTARLAGRARASAAAGWLTATPVPTAGTAVRIPWAVVLAPPGEVVGAAELSSVRFRPSDVRPAILRVDLGRVAAGRPGPAIEPLSHVDLQLFTRAGRRLGLLARLRDVVPGRYAFGITGRGPGGRRLPRGSYLLKLLAFPAAGGKAVGRSVVFTIG